MIDNKLKEIADYISNLETQSVSDYGIMGGLSGHILFLFYYSKYSKNIEYYNAARHKPLFMNHSYRNKSMVYLAGFLCGIILLGYSTKAHAQAPKQQPPKEVAHITGVVETTDGTTLPNASVFVVKSKELRKFVAQTVTDLDGAFSLDNPKGDYQLGVSYIGFETKYIPVSLKADTDKNVGKIVLKTSTNELQTVVIQGRAVRVHMKPDGFIVNVTTLRESCNDALDILRMIPKVHIEGETLSVMGKKKVIVQIGQVLQRMDADKLTDVLKSYEAGLVKSVEVVMQPALRYDRDGNTAMIILHMSSLFEEYMGGMLSTELMDRAGYGGRAGGYATLMYHKKKLFWSVSPSVTISKSRYEEEASYIYDDKTYQVKSPSEGGFNYTGGRFTMQYEYDKKSHVGVYLNVNTTHTDNEFQSYETTVPVSITSPNTVNENNFVSDVPKITTTAYWEKTFGDRDNKIWAEMSYYNYFRDADTGYLGKRMSDDMNFLTYEDDQEMRVSGLEFTNDYSINLNDAKSYVLDLGINGTRTITDHDKTHDQWQKDNAAETFVQRNNIEFEEWLVTPYVSATFRFSPKWWLRAGMRVSTTSSKLTQKDTGESDSRDKTVFLPNVHAKYSPSKHHAWNLTLNSYATQPTFNDLNPFEWRVNQHQVSRGNPMLIPSTTYKYNLGYTYKGVLSFSTNMEQVRNSIDRVTTIDNDIIYTQAQNAENSFFVGAKGSYYYNKLKFMTAFLEGTYGRRHYSPIDKSLADKRDASEWKVNGNMRFIFNKKRTFTGYVYGSYEGKKKTSLATIDPQYSMGVGLNYSVLKKRLSFELAGMNLLNCRYKGESIRDNYRMEFNNMYSYPTLYLAIRYRFSKARDHSNHRRNSAWDVQKRF
ncbi:MAG TPA: outer membrane beta-barrel family protein [Bacteroidaceae bacterium]|nr:outer membrane beta-barrel family protein [Bacteroidaceae bacterium]